MAKETLERVDQEIEFMEDYTRPLGQRILGIRCKTYPAMIVMSLTGMATVVEGDPLTHGMDPWKTMEVVEGLFDDGKLNWKRNVNYVLKAALQEFMKTLRSWILDQLTLDKEWGSDRVPDIQNHEIKKLKNSMREVVDVTMALHQWRHQHDTELRLEDYATDMLVMMDMEYLLSFLKRIVDNEIAVDRPAYPSLAGDNQRAVERPRYPSHDPVPSAPEPDEGHDLIEATSSGPPPPPPLSSVVKYQYRPLYKLLLRLKESMERVTNYITRLGESDTPTCLREQINRMEPSRVKEMKDAAMERIMNSVEQIGHENDDDEARRTGIRWNVKKLLAWIREQQKLDEEWEERTARLPTLSRDERMDMKRTFTSTLNKMVVIYGREPLPFYNSIYIEAQVIKGEMETLWALLTRIAEDELHTVPQF